MEPGEGSWEMRTVITIETQIKAVAREIAMRRNLYPKWIASGRLTQDKADAQIAEMEAVIETLKSVAQAKEADRFHVD